MPSATSGSHESHLINIQGIFELVLQILTCEPPHFHELARTDDLEIDLARLIVLPTFLFIGKNQ